MSASIDVVLPCLDEEAALPRVLGSVPEGVRAIVVDNGSTDATADVARRLGALVVEEPIRGYGAAVHAGVLAATAEIVAICDADGSFDLRELVRVTEAVVADRFDLVLGRRRTAGLKGWPVHARLANVYLARRLRRITGAQLHDLGPMRAARRDALLDLGVRDRRSGYPLEMVLTAAAAGWRIGEVDVSYRPRIGRSKVTGTVRGTAEAIVDMRRLLRETARS